MLPIPRLDLHLVAASDESLVVLSFLTPNQFQFTNNTLGTTYQMLFGNIYVVINN